MAYFNLSRKTPVLRTALQMYVNGEIINGAVSFIMRLETSSYPHVLLVFNDNNFFNFVSRSILPTYFCKGSNCIYQLYLRLCVIFVTINSVLTSSISDGSQPLRIKWTQNKLSWIFSYMCVISITSPPPPGPTEPLFEAYEVVRWGFKQSL